jgi:hypothetical protein
MCNQALIMTALGTVVTNQVIAKELMDNGQALAKELKEAAELVRLEK